MFDNLFQPVQVAGVTIPNRVVRAAHGTQLAFPLPDQTTSALIEYHVARARGGVGMSIIETAPVHESAFNFGPIPGLSESVVDGYRKLSDAVHEHGMKIFQQLWHGGSCHPNPLGGPPWSASDVPNPVLGMVPQPMTKGMIDEVVAGFATVARRCKAGGIDGVEIHAGHGYLPAQFLSPNTNKRDDEYGCQDIENRTRFCREVLAAIRAEVGADFPVGVRIVADEEYDGGWGIDDAVAIAQYLEPQMDFLSVSVGGYYRAFKMVAPMDEPLGYEIPKTSVVARAVNVPTILTGRIQTLDHASRLVEEGAADMVSIVRALIADPDLVRKTRDGRSNEVRPCIGSGQGCVGLDGTPHMSCVVNHAAGNESFVTLDTASRAPRGKRVLIAGGGPAGLEAARAAALQGHEVSLYEMSGKLGGQVAIAASAPHRADYGAITNYLAHEVERLGVKINLRTFVEPDLVAEFNPDVLIIATGSTPRRDGFQVMRPARDLPGANLAHVCTSWDVLGFGGRATIGSHAVIADDTGSYESICVADKLLESGAEVTLVTRFNDVGATVANIPLMLFNTAPARERLLTNPRFRLITLSHLLNITPTGVDVGWALGHDHPNGHVDADTVVMIGYNHQNRELADALDGSGVTVQLLGDAAGGSTLKRALRDGARGVVAS
jgi:2,4-dienoyl-CoA reductase-like NADH-dependent reductase (Old Yellow Enzyme family)